jgi:Ca2+-binding EF-hand superfamily protein
MKRMIPLALLALTTGVVAEAPQESAQQPTSPTDAFMKTLDKDGDDAVSKDEAMAPQRESFAKTDTNGDGVIGQDEAQASFEANVPEEMMQQMKDKGMPDPGETFMKNLDQNKDGKVDVDEFGKRTADSFDRMDADGDGKASRAEAEAFFSEMQKQMEAQMREMQKQHGGDAAPPQE